MLAVQTDQNSSVRLYFLHEIIIKMAAPLHEEMLI
jgi:hypothetical protein